MLGKLYHGRFGGKSVLYLMLIKGMGIKTVVFKEKKDSRSIADGDSYEGRKSLRERTKVNIVSKVG